VKATNDHGILANFRNIQRRTALEMNQNLITENLYVLNPSCGYGKLFLLLAENVHVPRPLTPAHSRGSLFSKLFTIVKQAGHGFCGQRSF